MKPVLFLIMLSLLALTHVRFTTGNLVRHGGGHLFDKCNTTAWQYCSPKYPLVCEKGACQCDSRVSRLVERTSPSKGHECVGLGNALCVDFKCIPNAYCVIELAQNGQHKLMCRCQSSNNVNDPRGRVNSTECTYHDIACDNWDACKFGRLCIDGNCQCPFPKHQYFNGTTCVSNLGGPCNLNPSSDHEKIECAPFATCVEVSKGKHKCVCPENMVESGDGYCDLGFGHWCSIIKYGDFFKHGVYSNRPCDAKGLLKCINGKCICPDDFHEYDENMKICRGMPGAHCTIGKYDGYTSGAKNFCVTGAYCAPKTVNSSRGVCKCEAGLEERVGECYQTKGIWWIFVSMIAFLLASLALLLYGQYWCRQRCANPANPQIVTYHTTHDHHDERHETASNATREADSISDFRQT